jgi:hypothetical protein
LSLNKNKVKNFNGDWGLGIGDWAQSPIPNPQSPIPNPQFYSSSNENLKIIINITHKNSHKKIIYYFI